MIIDKLKSGTNQYRFNELLIPAPIEFYNPKQLSVFTTPFTQHFLYPDYVSLANNNIVNIFDITKKEPQAARYTTSLAGKITGNITREAFLARDIYDSVCQNHRMVEFYDSENSTGYIFFSPVGNFSFSNGLIPQNSYTTDIAYQVLFNNLMLPSNFHIQITPLFYIRYAYVSRDTTNNQTGTHASDRYFLPDLNEYRTSTANGVTLNYKTKQDSLHFTYGHLINAFENNDNIYQNFSTPTEYHSSEWTLNFYPFSQSDIDLPQNHEFIQMSEYLSGAYGHIIYSIKIDNLECTNINTFKFPYEYFISTLIGMEINDNQKLFEVIYNSDYSRQTINLSPDNIIESIANKYYLNKSDNILYKYTGYPEKEMIAVGDNSNNDYCYFTQDEINEIFNPTS